MPVPESSVFQRVSRLASVADHVGCPTTTIDEVFTGHPLGRVPLADAADVHLAFTKAAVAQCHWAALPVHDRVAVIKRYRALVLENRDLLLDIIQAETGKARWTAQEEVLGILAGTRYYARLAPELLKPRRVPGPLPGLTRVRVHAQPKGVVGVIAPWNYPMFLAIGDSIPALLAGNAVVLKPASRTPFSALANAELLYEAGLPRDLLAVVPGSGSTVGGAIVENCDFLMFTGSSATGRVLARQCADRLIGCSAELGGKNPMIVTAGVDVDKVARAALRACFSNAGQLCLSIERVYVEQSIADEFTAKFVAAIEAMPLGPGYDFAAAMGSLSSAEQLATVAKHLADAKSKGAKVITGGKPRPDLGPLFFEPTVLTGVTREMDCAREETFGPLVAIYPVADTDQAIRLANDTEYGLSASVWAATPAEGEAIAVRLRSGAVNVDECYAVAAASPGAPMGGMGSSGLGRRHGPEGLLKYTEPQTVATALVVDLDAPPHMSAERWQRLQVPMAEFVGKFPGR
ncbi:succinic semialdehyde dehydrogenase [Nocardia anaemiae]|uniref:succinic semialdehyde dehydrogenase n=1 Tax=Nocardia anaemiae TaxID=263910 RepID=UPI0007A4D793|nr:succinic semialdehyde dehydrogenase [Nocardia anaemiae]